MAEKYIIDSLKLETVETLIIDDAFLSFNSFKIFGLRSRFLDVKYLTLKSQNITLEMRITISAEIRTTTRKVRGATRLTPTRDSSTVKSILNFCDSLIGAAAAF
jgi:hypothetical protein